MKTNLYGRDVVPNARTAPLTALILLLAASASAADTGSASTNSVVDLSLEDLLNVKVTSVSKQEENLTDAAAAIFVLNNDEIRRSGATTVADALRLVPGLQVAAIDSSEWAISSRGFNSQFSNKLLVMIDGRTVYTPLFSGVYWDAQQVFLDDVDRIEVIRGPGATIWGANAVNGVINILSKSARDTQGGLVYAGGGDVHQTSDGARYGDKIGENTYYRVYGNYQLDDDSRLVNGQSAKDAWDLGKGGFRLDSYTSNDGQLTWLGDGYAGDLNDRTGEIYGFSTLGRWTRRISETSNYEVQAYFDHLYRNDNLAEFALDTVDLTWQHTFALGEQNEVIWGLGYRFSGVHVNQANLPGLNFVAHDLSVNLYGGFVQDEFKIIPDRLAITAGAKIEHNDFTGFEVQPSARLTFKPSKEQTLWAAVSRAVRTPSEEEGKNFITFAQGAPFFGPGGGLYVPSLVGNPNVKSEELLAYELGYRVQPVSRLSLDVATFYNEYRHLIGDQPGAFVPGVPVGILALEPSNTIRAQSYGGEGVLTYAPIDSWRLSASYSLLLVHVQGTPAASVLQIEGSAPKQQVVLRSSYDFMAKAGLDAQLRCVDNVEGVTAYVTADVRVSYRPTPNLEFALVGQNLFTSQHVEQLSLIGAPTVEVARGFYGRITWRF